MTRASRGAPYSALRARVQELLALHKCGDAGAGNQVNQIAEALTTELTSARSFIELVEGAGYRHGPTLLESKDPRAAILADLYDHAQTARGSAVRAFRGIGVDRVGR